MDWISLLSLIKVVKKGLQVGANQFYTDGGGGAHNVNSIVHEPLDNERNIFNWDKLKEIICPT